MIILNTQKTKEEENSPLLSEGMVTEWPQAFQRHLVAGEGSVHACQVLKLPFRVTSVTSSLKRVGVLLLWGVFFFFLPLQSLSTFSEYLSSRQVRYEGREPARAVPEHHISLES